MHERTYFMRIYVLNLFYIWKFMAVIFLLAGRPPFVLWAIDDNIYQYMSMYARTHAPTATVVVGAFLLSNSLFTRGLDIFVFEHFLNLVKTWIYLNIKLFGKNFRIIRNKCVCSFPRAMSFDNENSILNWITLQSVCWTTQTKSWKTPTDSNAALVNLWADIIVLAKLAKDEIP